MNIYTIGVYGYSENDFFNKLMDHKIDVFIDIRRRRGMRGRKYAFVNSKYLQMRLEEIGIRYLYQKELSPTQEIRAYQKEEDKKAGVTKHTRNKLSQTFVDKYNEECLDKFDLNSFIYQFEQDSNILFFCVEKFPEACHRYLVTQRLADYPGVRIYHIIE
ncbi:MAG: hypothetical protein BAA01_02125 [Bacillus thermozeamaize]|uniref:DUF488 domain-containing protein n=1 Tax=Bacillus thermozeamaize TaxID=230954 RepID=A0A1Y3PX14_9BACI|nr:MAG: hypothetical protein BAA01_02125 [Bacillus thermozeamaize]